MSESTTFANTLSFTDELGEQTRSYAETEHESGLVTYMETTTTWNPAAQVLTTYSLGYVHSSTSGEWARSSTCRETGKATTTEHVEISGDEAEAWIRVMRSEHGHGQSCADCGELVGSQWATAACRAA